MGQSKEDIQCNVNPSKSHRRKTTTIAMVCIQKSVRSTNTSSTSSVTSSPRQKRTIRKQDVKKEFFAKEISCLRAVVPSASSSDLRTVLAAIQYIHHLQSQLNDN